MLHEILVVQRASRAFSVVVPVHSSLFSVYLIRQEAGFALLMCTISVY